MEEYFDFGGYATKNDLECSDGLIIRKDAFKHQDGKRVPLVWQHGHKSVSNVLGYAVLENRPDGVYAYGKFNESKSGKDAKTAVQHGDVDSLSIYANKLMKSNRNIRHGNITEVSIVLSGANPGAVIDYPIIVHGDGEATIMDDMATIYSGETIEVENLPMIEHSNDGSSDGGETIEDIINSMNEKQKNVLYALVSESKKGAAIKQSDVDEDDHIEHNNNDEGGLNMSNVFDRNNPSIDEDKKTTLSHDELKTIFKDGEACGSLRDSFLAHAQDYGIEDIDILFPDAKTVTPTPEMIARRMEWVSGVISGTRHTPFSRVKSTAADITADEARAKGYIKGNLKKEEVIKLLKRVTTPTTIYKKQKLDRDDIIDIVDLDVVAWLKAEMRVMLDEELARAILIGDGREVDDPDKISEENIRPIYTDDDLYAHKVKVSADSDTEDMIEQYIRARKFYKGSGNPTMYTTIDQVTDMLLLKDKMGRRIYSTIEDLKGILRVKDIVEVEVMEKVKRTNDDGEVLDLQAMFVNLNDYVLGADKGGQVSMFDDFDIDYNQHKYLIETRCSGALVKPKSAVVVEKVYAAG